jgi:hypothetical protein
MKTKIKKYKRLCLHETADQWTLRKHILQHNPTKYPKVTQKLPLNISLDVGKDVT